MRTLLFAVALALSAPMSGQVVSVEVRPDPATTLTPVYVIVEQLTPCSGPVATREGNTIRIESDFACEIITPPISRFTVPLGYLPAGTYRYEIYMRSGPGELNPDAEGSFSVAEAGAPVPAVPTLSVAGQWVAWMLLVGMAFHRMRTLG